MNISVNGQRKTISIAKLTIALEELGYKHIKEKINKRILGSLKEGDKLEVLSPQQGG